MIQPGELMWILKSVTSFWNMGSLETPRLAGGVWSEGSLVGIVPLNFQNLCYFWEVGIRTELQYCNTLDHWRVTTIIHAYTSLIEAGVRSPRKNTTKTESVLCIFSWSSWPETISRLSEIQSQAPGVEGSRRGLLAWLEPGKEDFWSSGQFENSLIFPLPHSFMSQVLKIPLWRKH